LDVIVLTDKPACAGGGLSIYTKFCTPSDVTLHLDLAQLPAQADELFSLGRAQALLARQRFAVVDGGLTNPVGDGLGRDTELTRKLRGRAARSNQLDHLLAELRRVRRSYFGHLRLLEHKE
jgi:hypothetical protein